jgi:hypothetical protein
MEMMNAPGMGYAATRIVGVLFDRLITRSVISYGRGQCDSRRRHRIDRRAGRDRQHF